MKLYRLYTGCEGEYGCDNYLGLFKTTDAMLSFVKDRFEKTISNYPMKDVGDISVSLNEKKEIFMDCSSHNIPTWLMNDCEYEEIDTDTLM